MIEIWKDCYGFEDYMKVSNLGKVYRKEREVINNGGTRIVKSGIIKTYIWGSGYEYVGITIDGKRYNNRVHRLVLQTFNPIENYKEMTVNHMDGDKFNNKLDNLEWMTHRENILHGWENGLMFAPERTLERLYKNCAECGVEYVTTDKDSKYCSHDCTSMSSRVVKDRPEKHKLYNILLDKSFLAVGRKYGVSDNAIRKWCKSYEIPHTAKYYREKRNNK